MADYSTASDNAADALGNDGFVEEYEISANGRRVKRGSLKNQLETATLLEGLAARRAAGGLFKLAKPRSPR